MTVAFGHATQSAEWTGTTPATTSHNPTTAGGSSSPRGVIIFPISASSTDSITGATYGGSALTLVPNSVAFDTATETGHVEAYFLGSNVPTGTQNWTVTQSGGNGVTRRAFCVTLDGSTDLEVIALQILQENQANPSFTLDSGSRIAVIIACLFSGAPSANVAPTAGLTSLFETAVATDARTFNLGRETTATTGSRSRGWTIASDDVAGVALAIAEVPFVLTPATLALTTATFAPTVTATQNQTVTPDTLALTTAAFAPTIAHGIIVPAASLALTTFEPTVTATAGTVATPDTASLVTETFAPTVTATAHQTVIPTTAALALTGFAPTVLTPVTVTPDTTALTLTTFAPNVGQPVQVTPTTASLTLATFAPTVTATEHRTVVPDTAALSLTAFAPNVVASDHQVVTPEAATLSLTAFSPTVTASDHQTVTPTTAELLLAAFAPTVNVAPPGQPGSSSGGVDPYGSSTGAVSRSGSSSGSVVPVGASA